MSSFYKTIGGLFWQFGKTACQAEQEYLQLPNAPLSPVSNATNATNSTCSSYNKYIGACSYPGGGQDSWFGPSLKVNSVNGIAFDSFVMPTHKSVEGVPGATACEITRPDSNKYYWYTGGLMGEVKQKGGHAIRTFQFKTLTDRSKAMAVSSDTVNPGIKYAHSVSPNII
jgi:hypothetical protein